MAQDFEESTKIENVMPSAPTKIETPKPEEIKQEAPTAKPNGEESLENPIEKHFRENRLKSDQSEDETLLEKHNIKIIKYLSKGTFSRVYEVDFNGKWAVAKITNSTKDMQVINDLYNLKEKLGEGAKHILNVYATFRDKDSQGNNIYIIVAEYLKPLNPHIKDLLAPEGTIEKPKSSKVFNFEEKYINTEYVSPIIEEQLNSINDSGRITKLEDRELILDVLLAAFTQILKNNNSENPTKMNEIAHSLRSRLDGVMDAPSSKILSTDMSRVFYGLINRNYFPLNSTEYNSSAKIYDVIPETESLMKTLKLLSSMGYNWADVREANVRERTNGDIVVSDPGMFGL